MTNTELRDYVADKLNKAIDLPLISEDLEAIFFQRMVELLWRHVPKLAKDAITSGAQLVDAGDLSQVTSAIQSALLPRIKELLWWRSDSEEIAGTVAKTFLDIAKEGRPSPEETPAA